MRTGRVFATGVALGVLIASAPACFPEVECGTTNCLGCCTASNECIAGTQVNECGTNGAVCTACLPNQACSSGMCVQTFGAGGDGGVNGGDGGGGGGGGGGDGGNDGGPTGGIALDQLCSHLTHAYCEYYVRCGIASSVTDCEKIIDYNTQASNRGDCTGANRAAVKDGRAAYDAIQARKCVDALAATASCPVTKLGFGVTECGTVFTGAVPTAGSCYSTDECGPTDACASTAMTCPSTCQPRKAVGQTVKPQAGEQCQTDLYAAYNPTANTYACEAKVAGGGNCAPLFPGTNPQQCVDGFYCSYDGSMPVCKAVKPVGEPCAIDHECAGFARCLSVASAQGECTLPLPVNSPCQYYDCKVDLACMSGATPDGGSRCEPRRAQGAPCLGEVCDPGLFCSGGGAGIPGSCAAVLSTGASCGDGDVCNYAAYCSTLTQVCTTKKPTGAACANHEECAGTSSCNTGVCQTSQCLDPTP